MPKFRDLNGKKFGRLTIIDRAENDGRWVRWNCVCECETLVTVRSKNLTSGHTKSCGCFNKDKITTHGQTKTPEYKTYISMKARCNNPNDPNYKHYGARGIQVCERWSNSFENFYEDMGDRPKELSLDRINVNGSYEPENCRWADSATQTRNQRRRTNSSSLYRGVFWKTGKQKWESSIKVDGRTIHIGTFGDEYIAALAFDEKAREVGYEEAWLNFPKEKE